MRKSFNFRDFAGRQVCNNVRRQERISETIEQRQVRRTSSDKYGENHGDPMHFSCHRYSEM